MWYKIYFTRRKCCAKKISRNLRKKYFCIKYSTRIDKQRVALIWYQAKKIFKKSLNNVLRQFWNRVMREISNHLAYRPLPILRLVTEVGLILNNKKFYWFSVFSKFCFYASFYCFILAGTFRFVTSFNV